MNTRKVWLQYVGRLEDGQVFDQTHPDVPLVYQVGTKKLIKGFTDGIQNMKVGEKRELIIPPALGYGKKGAPPTIPPKSTLIYEVELVKME